jgi:excisionase family DNA binding protein
MLVVHGVARVTKLLTPHQAADVLNVSPEYLLGLLDENRIPCTGSGDGRQLQMQDVVAFKDQRDRERRAGLRELSQLTQDFGGYHAELKKP